MATYFRKDGWVKSAIGPAVPGAQVYVCAPQPANVDALPPSPLANIFSDPNGLVPIVQPILTDGFGHYDYYALANVYTEVIGLGGVVQQVYPDQSLGGGTIGPGNPYVAGSNITIVGSTISAVVPPSSAVELQTNGVDNALQTKLNTKSTDGSVVYSADGAGGVNASVDYTKEVSGLGSIHGWYTATASSNLLSIGDNVTFINNGTKQLGAISATEGPFIHQVSQALANGQGTYYGNVGTLAQTSMWRGALNYWVARARMGIGAAHNWWIGMTDLSPAGFLMGTNPSTSNNICFYGANSGNFIGYCSNGVLSSTVNLGVPVDGAFHTFRMAFTTGTVTFFIDGVSVGSLTTNLPSTTAPLWPLSTMEGNAQDNDLAYMWWRFNH